MNPADAICPRTMSRRARAFSGSLIGLLLLGERRMPASIAAWSRVTSRTSRDRNRWAAVPTP